VGKEGRKREGEKEKRRQLKQFVLGRNKYVLDKWQAI
jgi:hypothetical protein